MQKLTVCHCGNCRISCNKHGKRAKCSDCSKLRTLGTIVENGIMRHTCEECCNLLAKKHEDEQQRLVMQELRKTNTKPITI